MSESSGLSITEYVIKQFEKDPSLIDGVLLAKVQILEKKVRRKEESIANLNDQIERMRERDRWVPVSERLPEIDKPVLLFNADRFMNCHFDLMWHGVGYRAEGGYWSVIGETRGLLLDAATHWKPITPPTDKG